MPHTLVSRIGRKSNFGCPAGQPGGTAFPHGLPAAGGRLQVGGTILEVRLQVGGTILGKQQEQQ